MNLTFTSPSISHGGEIPIEFTCEGKDLSPALAWTIDSSFKGTFALIVDDPDAPDPNAPKMTWVHWVLFNIPSSVREFPQGVSSAVLPAGTLEGMNDWGRTGYGGPCPPIGRHRYFFKLYALEGELPIQRPTKADLEKAMRGHILAEAVLMGTYQKRSKR